MCFGIIYVSSLVVCLFVDGEVVLMNGERCDCCNEYVSLGMWSGVYLFCFECVLILC